MATVQPRRSSIAISPAARALPNAPPHIQVRTVGLSVFLWLAACCTGLFLLGIVYLSSYAHIANEAYRHDRVMGMLAQEKKKASALQHSKSTACSSLEIDRKARAIGMIPADDAHTITLGAH